VRPNNTRAGADLQVLQNVFLFGPSCSWPSYRPVQILPITHAPLVPIAEASEPLDFSPLAASTRANLSASLENNRGSHLLLTRRVLGNCSHVDLWSAPIHFPLLFIPTDTPYSFTKPIATEHLLFFLRHLSAKILPVPLSPIMSSSSSTALSGLSVESSEAESGGITPEYNPAAAREALAIQAAIDALDALDFDFWAPWSDDDQEPTDDEGDLEWLLLKAGLVESEDEDDVSWEGDDDEEEDDTATSDGGSTDDDGDDELDQELVDIFADDEGDDDGFDGDTNSVDGEGDSSSSGSISGSSDEARIPGAKRRRYW
jgi:hypothetical protein